MKRAFALVLVAVTAGTVAAASSADVWTKLRRPLHIPRIDPGSGCPVTKHVRSGPAYPLLAPNAVLRYRLPPPPGSVAYGSPWTAVNIVWRVRAGYDGPLLLRGRRLDGSNVLRFERGQIPGTARWVSRVHDGAFRSFLRILTPGCYAFQVDGLDFSRTIVFRASLVTVGNMAHVVGALRARGLPMDEAGPFRTVATEALPGGEMFDNPGGRIVLWEFPSRHKAAAPFIEPGGAVVTIRYSDGGSLSAAIFCLEGLCSPDVPAARHWYRNGRVLAVYLGDDAGILSAMERLFGEQIAGTETPGRCLAAPVADEKVHAGPFTGEVNGPSYVVDGRLRLHVGGTNKMGWFLPRKRAKEAPELSVRGVRLAPAGGVFTDQLAEIFYSGKPENQHVYASNFALPKAGCWRLTFKTGGVKGSLVVLVTDG